jgi:hypothetical protein
MSDEKIRHVFVSIDEKSTLTLESDKDANGVWIVSSDGLTCRYFPNMNLAGVLAQLVGSGQQAGQG